MCRYIRFAIISLSQIYTVSTPHSCLLSSKETQTVGLHTDIMLNSNIHGQFALFVPSKQHLFNASDIWMSPLEGVQSIT